MEERSGSTGFPSLPSLLAQGTVVWWKREREREREIEREERGRRDREREREERGRYIAGHYAQFCGY